MKISLFSLVILVGLGAANVQASLYSCNSLEGEPIAIDESQVKQSLISSFTSPTWKPDTSLRSEANTKIPFLIYYAVDSEEPFMQLTTKYEIAKLTASCLKSERVNFAAVINSLYVEKNEIIICKSKNLFRLKIDHYPEFDKRLKQKRSYILEADHTEDEQGPMDFIVRFEKSINKPFYNYPLSHPDFVYNFISLLVDKNELFPSVKYEPILNLKSHGSPTTVLSGLHSCQVEAKRRTQEKLIGTLLTPSETKKLSNLTYDSDSKSLNEIDSILNKLHLGSSYGVAVTLNHEMGMSVSGGLNHEMGLNHDMGLNNKVGLGSNGLKAEDSFGMSHIALSGVLNKVFNQRTKKKLSFVMLESCETNRETLLNHVLDNILGQYTAINSLWYRNLNWWTILEASKDSTSLRRNIDMVTSNIANIRLEKNPK